MVGENLRFTSKEATLYSILMTLSTIGNFVVFNSLVQKWSAEASELPVYPWEESLLPLYILLQEKHIPIELIPFAIIVILSVSGFISFHKAVEATKKISNQP